MAICNGSHSLLSNMITDSKGHKTHVKGTMEKNSLKWLLLRKIKPPTAVVKMKRAVLSSSCRARAWDARWCAVAPFFKQGRPGMQLGRTAMIIALGSCAEVPVCTCHLSGLVYREQWDLAHLPERAQTGHGEHLVPFWLQDELPPTSLAAHTV